MYKSFTDYSNYFFFTFISFKNMFSLVPKRRLIQVHSGLNFTAFTSADGQGIYFYIELSQNYVENKKKKRHM